MSGHTHTHIHTHRTTTITLAAHAGQGLIINVLHVGVSELIFDVVCRLIIHVSPCQHDLKQYRTNP